VAGARDTEDQRRAEARSVGTPALVCPVCGHDSPLDEVYSGDGAPRCLHCGTPFVDDRADSGRGVVVDLFAAMHTRSVDDVALALGRDVVLTEPARGVVLHGPAAVGAHLVDPGRRPSLRSLTSDATEAGVHVASVGDGRALETWRIDVRDSCIISITVKQAELDLGP
jgi:hypothetical protein